MCTPERPFRRRRHPDLAVLLDSASPSPRLTRNPSTQADLTAATGAESELVAAAAAAAADAQDAAVAPLVLDSSQEDGTNSKKEEEEELPPTPQATIRADEFPAAEQEEKGNGDGETLGGAGNELADATWQEMASESEGVARAAEAARKEAGPGPSSSSLSRRHLSNFFPNTL